MLRTPDISGLEFWMQIKSHQCDALFGNSECLGESETSASCSCSTRRQRSFQTQRSVWRGSVAGHSRSAAARFPNCGFEGASRAAALSPASHAPPTPPHCTGASFLYKMLFWRDTQGGSWTLYRDA